MENIEIKELSKEYVKDVFEIEKTFFDVKNIDSITASLSSETLKFFLIFLDNKLVGFLECSIVLDEAEIYEIAIKNDYQGKGYSKNLMQFFLDFCGNKNIRTIFLEVNKINNKAISLYRKFGFKEYSIRKNYYGDNDAILMKIDR